MERTKEFPTATHDPILMLWRDSLPDLCLLYHNIIVWAICYQPVLEFSSSASDILAFFRDTFLIFCFLTLTLNP